jgi:predicted metal-dependent phosphoesterase TrpH
MTPLQLISHAAERGLSALSITDHDTIEAYTPETFEAARKVNLTLLTGVEFSTQVASESIHLLGYDFSLQDRAIGAFCAKHTERRKIRYRAILRCLAKRGMPIAEDELLKAAESSGQKQSHLNIGRPHIASMMVKLGYVQSLQEAFKKYLGDGRPCCVPSEPITPEETIDIIRQAGGVAIIAHPHHIKNPNILKRLLAMDFDGIECYYGKFPREEHEHWKKIAAQKGWLITGGSDFHGAVKPMIPLGCSWIDEEQFNRLKSRDHHCTP